MEKPKVTKKNKLRIKRIVDKNERIDKIKFMPIPSLKDVKHRPFIPAEIKPLITPDMYMKPRDRYGFSPPDELGLVGFLPHRYLQNDKRFVEIKDIPYPPHINNRFVIEDKKFHPETYNERLDVDKIVDSVEIRPGAEPLTPDERHALRTYNHSTYTNAYTGNKYMLTDIDDFLIKGMPGNYQPSVLRASMVKTIDDIEHALKKHSLQRSCL